MALNLRWVNHASLVLSDENVRLMSDPWLEGLAFNDGWKLLSPTMFGYDEFKDITHIWFSHEHPDHFAPLVIKKIPLEYRQKITVLYQCTIDNKVAEFCKKQGFKAIIQIYPNDKIKLSEGFTVSCQKVKNDTDSWMLIEAHGKRLLNLNDCHFHREAKRIEKVKKIVGNIDILFNQFSYARWVGNHDQVELHKLKAKEQLEEMKLQIQILNPSYVVPFASFVWFCHEENYFMNASVNHIGDVYKVIPEWGNYKPLVFYPNDVWDLSENWNGSKLAIDKYEKDFKNIITSSELVRSKQITLNDLQAVAEEFRQRCLKDNNVKKIKALPPFTFYLSDYQQSFKFSYRNGLKDDNLKAENTDVSLSSQAIWYCFKNDWGFSTLEVSGRFEKPKYGKYFNVENYRWVADLRNNGKRVPKLPARIFARLKQSILKD